MNVRLFTLKKHNFSGISKGIWNQLTTVSCPLIKGLAGPLNASRGVFALREITHHLSQDWIIKLLKNRFFFSPRKSPYLQNNVFCIVFYVFLHISMICSFLSQTHKTAFQKHFSQFGKIGYKTAFFRISRFWCRRYMFCTFCAKVRNTPQIPCFRSFLHFMLETRVKAVVQYAL